MAVRVGQPVIPKQLPSDQKLRDDVRKDARDTGKPAGKPTGKPASGGAAGAASAKGRAPEGTSAGSKALAGEGTSAGARPLQARDGMEVGGQVGHAHVDGHAPADNKHQDAQSRFQQPARSGGAHVPTQNQGTPAAPFRRDGPVASLTEQAEQDRSESQGQAISAREAMEGRAKLRAAVLDRLLLGMKDVHGRLAKFIKNPGRLGVVNLSLVLSESSLTYELWKEPSTVPERRERLAQTLGVSNALGDNFLLETAASGVAEIGIAGTEGRGNIRQGMLEASNVNVVQEITQRIAAQRAYEMNSKVIEATDQMLQTANNVR